MPARLTVVIAQSLRRDASTVDLEEAVVTQLMLAPGLDVVLVSSLDAIRSDSTDHLCLHDLPEEVVLIAWHEFADATSHWKRLGLSGKWTELGSQLEADNIVSVGGSARKIRYVRLRVESQIETVVETVQRVLGNRRVQAVPIQLGPQLRQATPSPPSPTSDIVHGTTNIASKEIGKPPTFELATAMSSQSTPIANKVPDSTSQLSNHQLIGQFEGKHIAQDQEEDWHSLDKLVDDLDALNL